MFGYMKVSSSLDPQIQFRTELKMSVPMHLIANIVTLVAKETLDVFDLPILSKYCILGKKSPIN